MLARSSNKTIGELGEKQNLGFVYVLWRGGYLGADAETYNALT